ncbi:MAG: hypothetical protein NWE92_08855 [Candidatus Bathyarchaeota archaeon]|nr:hypothetical protein [Candidatus Bathyarchaeota archaeon]
MVAMRKPVIVLALLVMLFSMESFALVQVTDANPSWGTSASPIPPIRDPPQIIINSPKRTEYNHPAVCYSNPVPLNITIIQPDSWVTNKSFKLPTSLTDNSDTVVVGQNTLRSITCIVDGQSFVLWNGTPCGFGITYYLPKVTEFSAAVNVSHGGHSLQVNVIAVSEYVTEGIIPFAQKQYDISASESIELFQFAHCDSTTVDEIKSSYVISPSSSIAPTKTPMPTQSPNPALMPAVPEFLSIIVIIFLILTILTITVIFRRKLTLKLP